VGYETRGFTNEGEGKKGGREEKQEKLRHDQEPDRRMPNRLNILAIMGSPTQGANAGVIRGFVTKGPSTTDHSLPDPNKRDFRLGERGVERERADRSSSSSGGGQAALKI